LGWIDRVDRAKAGHHNWGLFLLQLQIAATTQPEPQAKQGKNPAFFGIRQKFLLCNPNLLPCLEGA